MAQGGRLLEDVSQDERGEGREALERRPVAQPQQVADTAEARKLQRALVVTRHAQHQAHQGVQRVGLHRQAEQADAAPGEGRHSLRGRGEGVVGGGVEDRARRIRACTASGSTGRPSRQTQHLGRGGTR